jgi:hypothetical protein
VWQQSNLNGSNGFSFRGVRRKMLIPAILGGENQECTRAKMHTNVTLVVMLALGAAQATPRRFMSTSSSLFLLM